MNIFLEEKDRQVIPRWRDFKTTVSLGELGSTAKIRKNEISEEDYLGEKIRDWEANKTIYFASDLVGAAFVLGKLDKAIEAAKYLLSSNASEVIKDLANSVLGGEDKFSLNEIESDICNPVPNKLHDRLHNLRIRMRKDPRNSILLADIARIYAILGIPKKATWAMNIALKLSPINRYILRSATRLHLHFKDSEQAHDILRSTQSLRYDPWILAAEIAVAYITGRTSRFIKAGNRMLQSASYPPSQITELASVLGTLALKSGKLKISRKLFQQALEEPNENTVAQAFWASKRLKAFQLDEHYLEVPLSFEARYISFSQAKEWNRAVKETWRWLYDQPFSARPAIQGSYLAGVALENYAESEEIAKCGLISNPENSTLLNNLTFALANQENKIYEAEKTFSRIGATKLEFHMRIVWHATKGLIMYRKGNKSEGREYYLKAISMATEGKYNELRARAAIYLAREEKLSKSLFAENAINNAVQYCQGLTNPELELLLKRVLNQGNRIGGTH